MIPDCLEQCKSNEYKREAQVSVDRGAIHTHTKHVLGETAGAPCCCLGGSLSFFFIALPMVEEREVERLGLLHTTKEVL